ncbi:DinB family protein [Acidipila rosea]|uniref:Putative damage-inducible protein DinB n=1 Tax=Acidipila rosea TaxID=768535 RepID=A0A4R1L1H3_9BACT|nr:DinB family protein [Acidipila rosea]MBW4027438.1 hypothetical protein [Acidobacteriota bacterium]MBW4045617.1 hypothetical protein [Acidobacteriota bacterium]TCK71704.1 putative damage-inducible protein DinB [Acidipila rosea]
MTTAEMLLQDFDSEMSNTRRTLERVPEGKNDYAPHEKSMPMGKLAMHCATLPLFGQYLILDEGMDMANSKRPHPDFTFKSRQDCLAQFDANAAACRAAIASASDEALAAPWRFTFGEQLISNASRSLSFRSMFFNHLIHHTAQLGVYLRLNDIPVPALYGPSADEQWSPGK